MKQFFKHTTAILLAFIVLFATLSFTVDMHYCGDTLVDTAVFTKAESCGMDKMTSTKKDCSITKKDCCSEKQIVVKGQKNLKVIDFNVNLDQQLFFIAFVYTYTYRFQEGETKVPSYENYKPPIVVKEIHKLDEVYLI